MLIMSQIINERAFVSHIYSSQLAGGRAIVGLFEFGHTYQGLILLEASYNYFIMLHNKN